MVTILLLIILLVYAFIVAIPYIVRFVILMFGFVLMQMAYTYQVYRLNRSLHQFTLKFPDKSFDREIRSIKLQAQSWYIGSILYLTFFIIEFIIVYLNDVKFKLLVSALLLEEFSYFVPEMYIKIVHHRIFKQAEKDIEALTEQGTLRSDTNSRYELMLSLLE